MQLPYYAMPVDASYNVNTTEARIKLESQIQSEAEAAANTSTDAVTDTLDSSSSGSDGVSNTEEALS